MTFRSRLQPGRRTATAIEVPRRIVEALGAGKRPRVRVTINGHTYRDTVAEVSGRHVIRMTAEDLELAGIAEGDRVEVTLELDTERAG